MLEALRHVFTFRNGLIFILANCILSSICAVMLNGGIPEPLYNDKVRSFELDLAQHNASFAQHRVPST